MNQIQNKEKKQEDMKYKLMPKPLDKPYKTPLMNQIQDKENTGGNKI
jgi:hypothetical protein